MEPVDIYGVWVLGFEGLLKKEDSKTAKEEKDHRHAWEFYTYKYKHTVAVVGILIELSEEMERKGQILFLGMPSKEKI